MEEKYNDATSQRPQGDRVLVALHEGARMPKHKTEAILSLQVMDGLLQFITGEKTVEVEKGQFIVLHAGHFHSLLALKESTFLLSPITTRP